MCKIRGLTCNVEPIVKQRGLKSNDTLNLNEIIVNRWRVRRGVGRRPLLFFVAAFSRCVSSKEEVFAEVRDFYQGIILCYVTSHYFATL